MREVFNLFGTITMNGVQKVQEQLSGIEKHVVQAEKALSKWGRQTAKAGVMLSKNITAPIAGTTAAIGALAVSTGKYADHILDLEQITGLSTDTLQEFENVARVAGVSFDEFTMSASKFMQRLPKIIKESGPASDSIKALGINVFDASGRVRDMNDLFPELIKRLQSVSNVAERNAFAQQIFGESLKNLAPVLGMTAEQLDAARQEAHDLGLVMGKDALNAANESRAEFEKLGAAFSVLGRNLSGAFIPIIKDSLIPLMRDTVIPAVQGFAQRLGDLAKWFTSLPKDVQKTAIAITAAAAAAGPLLIVIGNTAKAVAGLRSAILLLNSALIANPFVLTAAAIGGVAIAIYNADKAARQWKATIADDIAQKQTDAIREGLERLIPYYDTLANASKDVIDPAEYEVIREEVGKLETNLADLGVQIDWNAGAVKKLNQAEALLNGMTQSATDSVEKQTDAYNDNADAILAKLNAGQKENEREEEAKRLAEEEKRKAKELADAKIQFAEMWDQKAQSVLLSQEARLEKEYQTAIDQAKKLGEETTKIEQYYDELRAQNAQARADREIQIERQKKDAVLDIFNTVASGYQQISNNITQSRIQNIDQELQKQIWAIERSTASEEEKQALIAKAEEDAAKRKKVEQRKQAIREKVAGIFSVAVNTAAGMMRAFKDFPAYVAPFIAAGIAATGAIQTGVIASQPLPMATGGLVMADPGKGIIANIGEGKQDELVLPMETGAQVLANKILKGLNASQTTNNRTMEVHLHIGNYMGDRQSLKELERSLQSVRFEENDRRIM